MTATSASCRHGSGSYRRASGTGRLSGRESVDNPEYLFIVLNFSKNKCLTLHNLIPGIDVLTCRQRSVKLGTTEMNDFFRIAAHLDLNLDRAATGAQSRHRSDVFRLDYRSRLNRNFVLIYFGAVFAVLFDPCIHLLKAARVVITAVFPPALSPFSIRPVTFFCPSVPARRALYIFMPWATISEKDFASLMITMCLRLNSSDHSTVMGASLAMCSRSETSNAGATVLCQIRGTRLRLQRSPEPGNGSPIDIRLKLAPATGIEPASADRQSPAVTRRRHRQVPRAG